MSCSLQFVSDWFVTRGWMLYDDYYDAGYNWDNEDNFFDLYPLLDPYPLLGIYQDIGIGVCQKMKTKRDKKLWG